MKAGDNGEGSWVMGAGVGDPLSTPTIWDLVDFGQKLCTKK